MAGDQVIEVRAGEGLRAELEGQTLVYKLRGADTGGQFALLEQLAAPGWKLTQFHVHRTFDEGFYVREGEFAFDVGARSIMAGPGALVLVPGGTPHRYANAGDTPARLLMTMTPAGFEGMFEHVAQRGIEALEQWDMEWHESAQEAAE